MQIVLAPGGHDSAESRIEIPIARSGHGAAASFRCFENSRNVETKFIEVLRRLLREDSGRFDFSTAGADIDVTYQQRNPGKADQNVNPSGG